MSREIKFRGKKENGIFVYGDLIQYENGDVAIFENKITKYGYEATQISKRTKVDVRTIGQFTGLYDKNGKNIYEGDIVQWEECVADYTFVTQTSEVFYDERSASFMPFGEWHYCDFEVIGNIFDNPELLED